MSRFLTTCAFLALLSACGGGQPLFEVEEEVVEEPVEEVVEETEEEGGLETDGTSLPPGTEEPTAEYRIFRYEAQDSESGTGGHARNFSYDADKDELTVRGLAFDGDDIYERNTAIGTIGGYAIYEADTTVTDDITGDDVTQISRYRAVVGMSQNTANDRPRTSFAIVRTGGYMGYGFGGFVYQREGAVVIPTDGQAVFNGNYGGVRVFDGTTGINYTRADAQVSIDFEGFGEGPTVGLTVTNREAFDENGDIVTDIEMPDFYRVIATDVTMDSNGEVMGTVINAVDGETYEEGTYYAIMAGDTTDPNDGGEIVGVLVVENSGNLDIGWQETGGFIVYRDF
ncbi:hypothetical protein HCZ30_07550 [Marivivens donghaensis]|uniref:Transferrin-binding protein B C-lobe/N-lobe beta barrel domain-containing protein n=1 Tax=Marivivens donghaensis TaxID=1699413 RepID=A0ABX0VWW7_9RHOB|nr:hypothetical protein [Marivivens donghaensis]NIY72289.1 hypothetical protein [Marivivens donghaensis]